jgi:hypothetical protein
MTATGSGVEDCTAAEYRLQAMRPDGTTSLLAGAMPAGEQDDLLS